MVREMATQSWGSRIIASVFGIIIGLVCIIGSFVLVFWNESNSLHTAQSLEQTQKILVSVQNAHVVKNNDRKVVYLTGLATTNDELKDSVFGVATRAIKLRRKVEMYQWQQNEETKTEKNVGGSETKVKTYTYTPVWSEEIIDSTKFNDPKGHQNPTSKPYPSVVQQAQHVNVGDYHLPGELISKMSGDSPIDLSMLDIKPIQAKVKKPVAYDVNGLYVGEDSEAPKIGDLKITLLEVLPQNVSVIAEQIGNALQPFTATAGKPVELLAMGFVSAQQMVHQAEVNNQIMMWIWRAVSFLLMFVGFALILRPLSVLADVIPLLGSLVGAGTSLIAFVAGIALWSTATAIAWFAVRPWWSVGLISIALICCVALYARRSVRIKN